MDETLLSPEFAARRWVRLERGVPPVDAPYCSLLFRLCFRLPVNEGTERHCAVATHLCVCQRDSGEVFCPSMARSPQKSCEAKPAGPDGLRAGRRASVRALPALTCALPRPQETLDGGRCTSVSGTPPPCPQPPQSTCEGVALPGASEQLPAAPAEPSPYLGLSGLCVLWLLTVLLPHFTFCSSLSPEQSAAATLAAGSVLCSS